MKLNVEHYTRMVSSMPPAKEFSLAPSQCKTVEDSDLMASLMPSANEDDTGALALIYEIRQKHKQSETQKLVKDLRRTTLETVITSFGLGHMVGAMDKLGGPVDTLHNARNNVYASEAAEDAYTNRSNYCPEDYRQDPAYIASNRKNSEMLAAGNLKDAYTGKKMARNAPKHQDHVISAKDVHNDRGRVLAGMDGPQLANASTNLRPTHGSINCSKKDKPASKFADELAANEENRKAQISELEACESLDDKQQAKLNKLNTLENVDGELLRSADKEARQAYNDAINKQYYSSGEFKQDVLASSLSGGSKMGLQQALGLALHELVSALMDEVHSIWVSGFKGGDLEKSIVDVLKVRMTRVAGRLTDKWQDILSAFVVGGVSGIFSNLITVLTNAFITTSKRIIRLVREGIFSLVKAVKLLVIRPDGMTGRQAAHEAFKLVAAGAVVAGGLVLEEYIEKAISSLGIPFASEITSVCLGLMTGVSTVMLMVVLDKIDLFGQKAIEDKEALSCALDQRIEDTQASIRGYVAVFD
jgi:hypothetical protein